MRTVTDTQVIEGAKQLKNSVAFAALIEYLVDAAMDTVKASDPSQMDVREDAYQAYRAVKNLEATVRSIASSYPAQMRTDDEWPDTASTDPRSV